MTSALKHVRKLWTRAVRYFLLTLCHFFQLTRFHKIRADYKLVAKAYGRIGTAYTKKDDLASAIKFFNKSLTEHRTPDILNKLRETERIKSETERQAYIDPELSAKSREEGNALFKKGDFAGAVKAYSESIKRNPDDARGYNNRANAYTKLVALPEALKDADQAIKVDPKFSECPKARWRRTLLILGLVKAYIRKSHILLTMRDYSKAIEALQEAAEHDDEKKHTTEIQEQIWKCQQAQFSSRDGGESDEELMQRAMRDPEVAVGVWFEHGLIYSDLDSRAS
jgi:stress-induced-phosphoprotein 1